MEKSIETLKTIIEICTLENCAYGGIAQTEHHRIYYWTNERINKYLELVDFTGKSNALSVLASGDQAFNLVTNGILDIDTFDINDFTEYFALGIKRAMILKYNYEEFIKIMQILRDDTSLEYLSDILMGLLPYMDEKCQKFWNIIIYFNYNMQKRHETNINIFQMISHNYLRLPPVFHNNYLQSKENYDLLRSRLAGANITFKQVDARNLSSGFNSQYDFVLLSNILDYAVTWCQSFNYDFLRKYESQLEMLCKDNGTIFLHYLFDYDEDNPLFGWSSIFRTDLEDEEIKILPTDFNSRTQAMILKRVNHKM